MLDSLGLAPRRLDKQRRREPQASPQKNKTKNKKKHKRVTAGRYWPSRSPTTSPFSPAPPGQLLRWVDSPPPPAFVWEDLPLGNKALDFRKLGRSTALTRSHPPLPGVARSSRAPQKGSGPPFLSLTSPASAESLERPRVRTEPQTILLVVAVCGKDAK